MLLELFEFVAVGLHVDYYVIVYLCVCAVCIYCLCLVLRYVFIKYFADNC